MGLLGKAPGQGGGIEGDIQSAAGELGDLLGPGGQGNQVLSSLAGSNAFAEIPAGMTVGAQEEAEAFLIGEL